MKFFVIILTLIFITLKLMGHIAWAWVWVLSPMWIWLLVILGLMVLALLFALLAAGVQSKNNYRMQARFL